MQTCLPELGEHQMRVDQQDLLPIAVISYESAHPLPSPHSHPTHIYTRNNQIYLKHVRETQCICNLFNLQTKTHKTKQRKFTVQTTTITVVTKKVSLNFIYILFGYLISYSFSLFHQLMINNQIDTRNPQLNK